MILLYTLKGNSMTLSTEFVLSLFTALGLGGIAGGIVGAYFQNRFEQQKQVNQQEHELKRRRYGAILILMLTKLDPVTGLPHLREMRPDLKNLKDIEKEIEVELLNGVLFASDDVLKNMSGFVRKPDYNEYIKTAMAMRRDLWGKDTKVDEAILKVVADSELRSK